MTNLLRAEKTEASCCAGEASGRSCYRCSWMLSALQGAAAALSKQQTRRPLPVSPHAYICEQPNTKHELTRTQ